MNVELIEYLKIRRKLDEITISSTYHKESRNKIVIMVDPHVPPSYREINHASL